MWILPWFFLQHTVCKDVLYSESLCIKIQSTGNWANVVHFLSTADKDTFCSILSVPRLRFASDSHLVTGDEDGARHCHSLPRPLATKQSPDWPLRAIPCLWIFTAFWNMSQHSEQNRVEHCDRYQSDWWASSTGTKGSFFYSPIKSANEIYCIGA